MPCDTLLKATRSGVSTRGNGHAVFIINGQPVVGATFPDRETAGIQGSKVGDPVHHSSGEKKAGFYDLRDTLP